MDTLVETSKVGELAAVVGDCAHVPVDAGLPDGIVHPVEDVEEHGANIGAVRPIDRWVVVLERLGVETCLDLRTRVTLLESPAAAPDHEGEDKQDGPDTFGTGGSPEVREIQHEAKDTSAEHLRSPVQNTIQRPGADVELGGVDFVELVGVEPVRGEEHREEEDDVWIGEEGLPQAEQLALPCWILHENDLGAVAADDLVTLNERERKKRAAERQDKKTDISSVGHRRIDRHVDVLA